MAPPITAPVALFPPPPSLNFALDGVLQAGVAAALAELVAARGAAPEFGFAIIDLGGGSATGTLKFGEYKGNEEHYVASAVKVAGMLGAFALRDLVHRFVAFNKVLSGNNIAVQAMLAAATAALGGAAPKPPARPPAKPPKAPTLFAQLTTLLDPAIEAASSPRLKGTTQRAHRVPQWNQVLTEPRPGFAGPPDFRGEFTQSLRDMIVPSSNPGAGRVIRGVGYGYLNGMTVAAKLFDVPAGAGVWLAGDFVGQYPYARINSANDGMVAQAGTALSMAKMLALIVNEAVIDAAACRQMKALLVDSVTGVDTPFLTREAVSDRQRIPLDRLTHCKLGLGPLKKGGNVLSEIFRLEGLRKAGKAYAVAYQNCPDSVIALADVAFMIRKTLEVYEG